LQNQIAPLKADRLKHHEIIHRLKFESVIASDGTADKARSARENAEVELAELQSRITPLQTEINQLTRQFWVTKEQVKANKYDLSTSRSCDRRSPRGRADWRLRRNAPKPVVTKEEDRIGIS
jgi:type I restriction enzyme M protein